MTRPQVDTCERAAAVLYLAADSYRRAGTECADAWGVVVALANGSSAAAAARLASWWDARDVSSRAFPFALYSVAATVVARVARTVPPGPPVAWRDADPWGALNIALGIAGMPGAARVEALDALARRIAGGAR